MVHDFWEKIRVEWIYLLAAYALYFGIKMVGGPVDSLWFRALVEGGMMVFLMVRWEHPKEWIATFIPVAVALDYSNIVSITKLGIVVLLFGFWWVRQQPIKPSEDSPET